MRPESYLTPGGISVTRTISKVSYARGLSGLLRKLDTQRGIYLSSGYEFPGRYSRWDIAALAPQLKAPADAALAQAVAALDAKAEQLESKAKERRSLAGINNTLTNLATESGDGDRAPPEQYRQAFALCTANLQDALKSWQALQSGDLAALNADLKTRGLAPLTVAAP